MEKPSIDLQGVSLELYSWGCKSKLLKKVFREIDDAELHKQLLVFLGENEEKREVAAIVLYKLIWNNFVEFGPFPPIQLLAEFEHDRVYYSNYRDHTTHSVRTCLIGLYLYEQNAILRNSLQDYLKSVTAPDGYDVEDTFIAIWLLTALCHDIGYIIEHSKIESNTEIRKKVIDYINNALMNPFSNIATFASRISDEKESYFINKNRIFIGRVTTLADLEEDLIFSEFEGTSKKAHLSHSGSNGLKSYYDFAKQQEPTNKQGKFRDHGISSALLLIKVWRSYRQYIHDVCDKDYQDYYGDCADTINSLNENLDSFYPLVRIASESISLHNINKKIWDKAEALCKEIDLDGFSIMLQGGKDSLPFAFLLRLCDELQMWDRPRFRAPTARDESLHSCDIILRATDDGIYLQFPKDEERYRHPGTDPSGEFQTLKDVLKKYLQQDVINKLLIYGPAPLPTKVADTMPFVHVNHAVDASHDETISPFPKDAHKHEAVCESTEWLVGAVNLDEDIHFSSFYLEQSLACNLPSEYQQYGYHNIIAVYDDFNETYYIPKSECISVSNNLIRQSVSDPQFLEKIIDKIIEHIKSLEKVFSGIQPEEFSKMPLEQLTALYKKHNRVHRDLYTYARIPEALDRGCSTFSSYLKEYLRAKSSDFSDETKLNEVFEALTYPENLSHSGQEIIELYELISQIKLRDSQTNVPTFSENSSRTLINMDDEIRCAIERYSSKWAFWGYHGYRNRAIRDFNYFVEKLRVDIKSSRVEEQSKKLTSDLDRFYYKKYGYCSTYNIDAEHRNLFKLFSRIGTIKIYRRYVQLINFYYLDLLISQIAHRFSVSESVIRCMLPSEVERLLDGETALLNKGMERNKSKTFVLRISDNSNEIICGDAAHTIYSEMKDKTSQPLINQRLLHGDAVSKGKVRGVGRVLTSGTVSTFERNDILVCVDSDPDLFEYIKMAGAVLAESGGLTCHAAIVCRELRIPCIVRIPGLMASIHDGDIIDVDADIGQISISTSISTNIVKSLYVHNSTIPGNLGRKATALIQLKQQNMNIPDFICIPIALLQKMFAELESDSKGAESQALISEIKTGISELNAPFFAIRSSTSVEDGVDFSGAGQEITRLHVTESDVISTLESMISEITSDERNITGSIIVQKMVFGEISGVMFTRNPMSQDTSRDSFIIETVRGGNEHLTSGRISPTRYTLSNGEYAEETGDKWGGKCTHAQLQLLEQAGREIENYFGAPQDIEWTIVENTLYILQSRNITGNTTIDRASITRRGKKDSQVCIAIYQNYALPLVLQTHMLRVAAVGKWIIDRWNHPDIKLNERTIIETLLLHDIGNIVKGEDENFSKLFPDTYPMESFEYWVNVRKWVSEHYGESDTMATKNIVREIGVSQDVQTMIEKKQFTNNRNTYMDKDYVVKICAYADQRVSPNGVMSLSGRLGEAIKRYQGVKGASVNSQNRQTLIQYAHKIEAQIFEYVNGSPDSITDDSIECYIQQLKSYEFKNLSPEQPTLP